MQLRNYQEVGVTGIRSAYIEGCVAPLLCLPTGGGKCLAPGTPVIMHDGSIKSVENVNIGDLLMGPDSKPRKVLSVCTGIDSMYRIIPTSCGEAWECNEPHILSLVCNADISRQFRKDQVYNVSVKEYLQLPKSVKHCLKLYRAGVEFAHKETGLDPYFLGLWLGDGTSRGPIICNMEQEIEDYLYEYASKIGHYIHKTPNGETKAWNYGIYSESQGWGAGIRGALTKLNLIKNKHIPKQYLINSREQRLRLLAGLIDTDGYLHNNSYEIHVAHEQLGHDIVYLCRSLGFAVHVGHKPGIKGLRLGISGSGLEQIPCKVPRKKASPRQQIKDALRTGFTVESIGQGMYYGFEIDGDRLFLLGDFTVTHNTVVFSYVCKSAAAKGKRVLVLAHRKELISQASNKLRDLGVRHGLIAPNYTPKPHELVQVASVQTLVNKLGSIQAPDLIVIDEGHHAPAGTWDTIRKAFPDAKILGVTATPIRSDNKGLATVYDYLVQPEVDGQPVTTKWLMREGFLSEAVCYCPDSGMDTSALKRGNSGDFTAGSAEKAINKPRVTGDAVALYRKYAHAQPAIAFCASVKHAEVVAEEFRAAGYRVGLFTGDVGGERDAMIQGLASGKYHVLAACEMISEGTDIPVCSVAILMRPTSSLGLHLQQVGRVLRPVYAQGMPLDTAGQRLAAIANGPKPRAIIIDMAGNVGRWEGAQFVENLGFPDTEWEWSLDTDKPVRRKAEAEPAEKTIQTLVCGNCAAFYLPAPKCPMCGTARPTKERKIIFTEGELREAQAVAKAEEETRKAAEVQANKNARSAAFRAKSVADIEAVAQAAGKDKKWVFAMVNVVEKQRGRKLP